MIGVVMAQSSLKYQQYFLQPMIQYICDKQGEVRQAAAYGIGVMAQFGGQGYLQAYTGMSVCMSILVYKLSVLTDFLKRCITSHFNLLLTAEFA